MNAIGYLFGAVPKEIMYENINVYSWQKILDFPSFLYNLNVDIGIAPLEKCLFNDCKSNLKALEFAALGIPGVYSDADPYKNMKYHSDDYFIENLQNLIDDIELRENIYQQDYNTLKDSLYWDDNSLTNFVNSHLKLYKKVLG